MEESRPQPRSWTPRSRSLLNHDTQLRISWLLSVSNDFSCIIARLYYMAFTEWSVWHDILSFGRQFAFGISSHGLLAPVWRLARALELKWQGVKIHTKIIDELISIAHNSCHFTNSVNEVCHN